MVGCRNREYRVRAQLFVFDEGLVFAGQHHLLCFGFESADRHSETRDEPMRRDRENGLWLGDFSAKSPPCFGVDILGHDIHGIAMSEEDRGQHFWRTDSHITHENANLLCKSDLLHEV